MVSRAASMVTGVPFCVVMDAYFAKACMFTALCIRIEQFRRADKQGDSRLDQVTQQNSMMSENLSSASLELSAQAEQLWSIMRFFKIDERLHAPSDARPQTVSVVDDTRGEADKGSTGHERAIDLNIGKDDRNDEFKRY